MNKVQAIFRKGMDPEIDSYSGFYDNGHKRSTGLRGYLKERDVKEVYVCGLAADYCVFFTVRDALKDGLKTFLVEDATRPINKEGFKNAKKEVVGLGGAVINSEEILDEKSLLHPGVK
jgi:nicotinamidase/pyrazinamidase